MNLSRTFLFLLMPCLGAAAPVDQGPQLKKEEALAFVKQNVDQWGVPLSLKPRVVRSLDKTVNSYYEQPQAPGLYESELGNLTNVEKTRLELRLAATSQDPAERAKMPQLLQELKKDMQVLAQDNAELQKLYAATVVPQGPRPQRPEGAQGADCRGERWSQGCVKRKVKQGLREEALQDVNAQLEQNPDDTGALSLRAQLYAEMGKMAEANADARHALAVDPSDRAAFAVAKLTQSVGNVQAETTAGQAAAYADALTERNAPAQSAILLAGGPASAPQTSAPAARQAPAPPPRPDIAQSPAAEAVKSARAVMQLGDMRAAVPYLDQALQAEPRNVEAYRLRSVANAAQGSYHAALRDVEAGLRLAPRDASLLISQSFAKNRLHDYQGALESAEMARQVDPDSPDALANYAYAVGGLGDREKMLDLLGEAARKDSRYESSVESAKGIPAGSEVMFLFPGEAPGASAAAAQGAKAAAQPGRAPHRGVMIFASAFGALLLGFGLLEILLLKRDRRGRR